jgi:hypothetical protein
MIESFEKRERKEVKGKLLFFAYQNLGSENTAFQVNSRRTDETAVTTAITEVCLKLLQFFHVVFVKCLFDQDWA